MSQSPLSCFWKRLTFEFSQKLISLNFFKKVMLFNKNEIDNFVSQQVVYFVTVGIFSKKQNPIQHSPLVLRWQYLYFHFIQIYLNVFLVSVDSFQGNKRKCSQRLREIIDFNMGSFPVVNTSSLVLERVWVQNLDYLCSRNSSTTFHDLQFLV